MLLAVVIPVFNEQETLEAIIDRVLAVAPPIEPTTGVPCDRLIVLVDDGSSDSSAAMIREFGSREGFAASCHPYNRGKGAALSTGFGLALEQGADIVLVQDADLEYDPAEHGRVLEPILTGKADVVIGSRFLGQSHRVLYYWHFVANRMITTLSNMLTNLNLTDVECCFKAFTGQALSELTICERRFGVEPEIVAKVSRMRLCHDPTHPEVRSSARIFEVPVSYAGRTYEEGKKITWRDGVSALRCIVRYNLFA